MDVGGMDLTEQLVATLRNFMRDTAKKLAVLILDSNRKGIVQLPLSCWMVIFSRLEISCGYA